VILRFGDWHGEPPLVSQVYSERVLTSLVPLILRGKLGRTQGSNSTSSEYPGGVKLRNTQTEYSHSEFSPTTDIDPGMVQRPPIKATVTLENYHRGRVESHAVAHSRASPTWKVALS
jgi:hypothetical protein